MIGSFQFGVAGFDAPGSYDGAATLSPSHAAAAAAGTFGGSTYFAAAALSAPHAASGSGTAPLPVYAGSSALAAAHASSGAGTAPLPVYAGSASASPTHAVSASGTGNSVIYTGAASASIVHAAVGSAALLPPPRVGSSSLSHHSVAIGAGVLKVIEVRFKDTRLVNFLHVGDVGAILEATVDGPDGSPLDLSTASALGFVFQKPDGTILTTAASLKTDGTDGVAQYAFSAGDLDQAGTWHYQLAATIGAASFRSDVGKLRVAANLPL